MKLGPLHSSGVARAAIMICSGLALHGLRGSMAQTQLQTQSQSQAQSGSASSPANDAAAKVAERKRRFDEQRKLLESGYVPPKEQSLRSDPDLVLSPIEVNLLVGDRVAFHLYDKGKEVSGGSWGVIPGRILGS